MVRTIIIGGGLAGLIAANQLIDLGMTNVTLVEAKAYLGGKLRGFQNPRIQGIPLNDYIEKLSQRAEKIDVLTRHTAIAITKEHVVVLSPNGTVRLPYDLIFYAGGGREINRYDLRIYGDNVAGVFTAVLAFKIMKKFSRPIAKKMILYGDQEYLEDVGRIAEELGTEVALWVLPKGKTIKTRYETTHGKIEVVRGHGRLDSIILRGEHGTEKHMCDALVIGFGFKPTKTKLLLLDSSKIKKIGYAREYYPRIEDMIEKTKGYIQEAIKGT